MISNTWKSIFAQSPANSGYYDETELPHFNWDWPQRHLVLGTLRLRARG